MTFPLPEQQAYLFPSGRGVASVGKVTKLQTAVHYEFTEFHRRLNAPLEDSSEEILDEYVQGVLLRIQDEGYCMQILELASIVVSDVEFPAAKIPRWLAFHCVDDFDSLLDDAKQDETRFWEILKLFSLLDATVFVSELLQFWLHNRPNRQLESSMRLLLGFYTQVPPLSQISTFEALEKRRNLAAIGKQKSEPHEGIDFMWNLQICHEDDSDSILSQIRSVSAAAQIDTLPWYFQVCLVWTWLHPMDTPGTCLVELCALHAPKSDTIASVVDASVYALLTLDFPSFFIVLTENWDPWFPAICADYLFYTNHVLPEIRDELLLTYCADLIGSQLGTRIALDIVSTLSRNCAVRGSRELLGRLAKNDRQLGSTKQWLLCVKLAHDLDYEGPSLAESLCLEQFHRASNVVDAVFALSVAAEVGKDINLGACRISDYVDQDLEQVKKDLRAARECSLNQIELLPEYIQSGRFEFANTERTNLVQLVTSPNCPPESILPLVLEIRALAEKGAMKLSLDEIIGIQTLLIEHDNMQDLLRWFTTYMVRQAF